MAMPRNTSRIYIERGTWGLLTVAAVGVGLVSLRYLFPHVAFPLTGSNMVVRRQWVIAHAAFSSIAILSGPWQFLPMGTLARRPWHRWLGRIYLLAVLVGWVTSIPIAAHAQTGRVAQFGFLTLGLVWVGSSALAYTTIRKRQVQAHRRWMIRSYALTCSAISLRIMIPLSALAGYEFESSYAAIAWACWLVNLLIAEVWIRLSQNQSSADERRVREVTA